MKQKWGQQDLIDIVDINQDFLRFFTTKITRPQIIEGIKNVFSEIRSTNPKIVLDVKGVVPEEETIIKPHREYCE